MTEIDDALNSSTPMFHPVAVTADWEELPPGVSVAGLDPLRDLGQQVGPNGFEVSQSFDDSLPDPVTMTMSNDASGSLTMDMVGRSANIADVITGWRSTTSGFGSGTAIVVTLPSDLGGQDYTMVAITVNNQSRVWEDAYPEGHPHGWVLLGSCTDGGLSTYLFGRPHYATAPAPDFQIETSASYSWVCSAIAANFTVAIASNVPTKPGTATAAIETVTQTGHTGPYATLPSRGWLLGVFSTAVAAGPWTATGGATQLVQNTGGVAALQMVRTAQIDVDGDYRFTSSTAGSTGVAMMINVPLRIMDRQAMDALSYFSPFNTESPIQNFERDTAPVSADVSVVSPGGIFATRVFKGQMADIKLTGRTAQLEAVSRTRINLDRALTLPTVAGNRQSCTTDWLASYVLARGGQYNGVAPSPQTRFWVPMHGSLQPFMDGPIGYSNAYVYTTSRTPTGPYGKRPPETVDGPFSTAMHAHQNLDETTTLSVFADRNWATEVPGMEGEFNDLLSQQNSVGRLTFWLRGDAAENTPPVLGGTEDLLFSFNLWNDVAGAAANLVRCDVRSDRKPQIWLGSSLLLTGGDMPTDGLWHFFGFVWNYDTGVARFRRDGVFWDVSGFSGASETLPVSEAAHYAAGRFVGCQVSAHIPVAEVQLEAGPTLYADQWTRFHPTPTAPSMNTIYRPTRQWIEAVAEPTPVQGWTVLSEIAQATLSHLRVNEEDNVEMVPLYYFGETAQMTVDALNIADTDVNASELVVVNDASKTRNLVTAEYIDTRVDTNRSPILTLSSSLAIPRGITEITFALDVPAGEIHGALTPYPPSTTWDIQKLTASQVSGATVIQNEHVMSVNTTQEGNGTVFTSASFTARIFSWDSSTVSIRFTNTSPGTLYLANSGTQIPFLRILGYAIREVTSYQTVEDAGSIGTRRQRALTTQVRWIQRRLEALQYAGNLVTSLARPRAEVAVTVMGDPRRRPGDLVQLNDAEGTRAAGTWRVLAVKHRGNGAMYVQDLQLVQVGAVGIWDQSSWDESVWGE